jgi:transcriptional regulator with GAF, ATPase, and Fis domain
MSARLKAVTGPLEGTEWSLPEGAFTIGRDHANALCLAADAGASKRHCVILEHDQEFTIRDLDSHNHTYVNERYGRERPLTHGDEIRIGHSVFVFLVDGQPPPRRPVAVDLDEGEPVSGSTVTLRRADAPDISSILDLIADAIPPRLALRAESPPDHLARILPRDVPSSPRPHGDLSARLLKPMVRVCRAVTSVHRLDELQHSLIDIVFDSISAGRAAILLAGANGGDFVSALHRRRSSRESGSFRIPRAVIQRVLRDRSALCVNDVFKDGTMLPSETIQKAHITSIMAAPIVVAENAVGAIYVDASDPIVRFGEDDLQLLTGIADAAAAPLANALKAEQLERENERLLAELSADQPLVGSSERMRAVHRFIMKVAASDSTVLISGASGTGKELVARAIHRRSVRSGKPFVAVNCAAITETLIESEFFGHEKGAFTGAFAQKKGKLEEADGGTVFLDEVGELALPLQAKLLRVLQEREFERVGGTRPIKVNLRVIAASNRDLEQETRRGAFRQDLYFRLNVVLVTMPELRERREDIQMLATHFLHKHAKKCARRVTGISEDALACLIAYDWPGNVRELENAIERALVLGTTEHILPDDLPESIAETDETPSPGGTKFHEIIRQIKKQLVTKALDDADGSYAEAAKRLGLHPNNLHRLMKTLHLK